MTTIVNDDKYYAFQKLTFWLNANRGNSLILDRNDGERGCAKTKAIILSASLDSTTESGAPLMHEINFSASFEIPEKEVYSISHIGDDSHAWRLLTDDKTQTVLATWESEENRLYLHPYVTFGYGLDNIYAYLKQNWSNIIDDDGHFRSEAVDKKGRYKPVRSVGPNGRIIVTDGPPLTDDWREAQPVSHYAGKDGVDVIAFIEQQWSPEAVRGFMAGNIIKYATRLGRKDDEDKELAKIIDYAERYRKYIDKGNN